MSTGESTQPVNLYPSTSYCVLTVTTSGTTRTMGKKTALAKVQQRALTVDPQEAENWPWDHADLLIANAMVNGNARASAISDETGLTVPAVRERLLDPVRCAWLSREIHRGIGSRIGMVHAALFARVQRNGDPQAAKLLLAQYGELLAPVDRKIVDHRHMHVDLSAYTLEELDKLAKETARKLNRPEDVIDVTPRPSDVGAPDSSAAGDAAPGPGVPDSVVPAA